MSARYQVLIRNQEGEQVGFLTDESSDFVSLYCTKMRNGPGHYRLEVDGSLAHLFDIDGQIVVQRRAPEFGIMQWYPEFAGFHVSEGKRTLLNGTRRFISEGFSYLDLVRREEIAYRAATSFSNKAGAGETVIKQFVDENIGPSAASPERLLPSVMPNLTIQPDLGRGSYWEGGRSWKSLLETVQEVATATGLAFDIVEVEPAVFMFLVKENRLGENRSTEGLDQSTRLNSSGNSPVHFSLDRDNMLTPMVQITRSDVVNVVYALGAGEKDARLVLPVTDEYNVLLSPWNRRAVCRNASQETTLLALQSVGEEILNERRARAILTFQPQQTFSTVYGRDYFFGDRVTATYEGVDYHLEIVEVELTFNENGEDLRFRFE